MHKTKIYLFLLFPFLISLMTGCNMQRILYRELQESIARESQDGFQITVYFIDPFCMTRTPISLEDLLSEKYGSEYVETLQEGLGETYNEVFGEEYEGPRSVFHLSGQQAFESVRVIRDKLLPEMIVPTEQSGKMNARLCYVLENSEGKQILELIVYAGSDSVYFNGTEVKTNAIFYEIIYPCMGEKANLLWQYFGSVVDQNSQSGSSIGEVSN